MEFSFDRSRNTNSNTSNNNQQATSAAGSAGGATDEVDTSQIANERLRKAIERNRARQRDRESQSGSRQGPTPSSSANSAWAQHQAHANMSNPREMEPARETTREPVRESYREQPVREAAREQVHAHENIHRTERPAQTEHVQESFFEQKSPSPRPDVVESVQASTSEEMISPRSPTRRTVARPHDTEFAPTVKRTTKRAAAQISYTTGTKKKGKELDPKLVDYLVKGTWLFCGFLVLRLIFASGGVTDYFSQKSTLNDRLSELSRIKNENMGLVSEIERMQLDAGYQKKLVRDNLGFIAPDEYLVLFPKD